MPDWVPSVIVQVFAAGVVWGTLKAELRALRELQQQHAERLDQMTARIDRIMERA